MPTLRFWSLIAAPKDWPPLAAAALTEAVRSAFASVAPASAGSFAMLQPGSELALRQAIAAAAEPPDLIHLVLHAEARPAAQYVTLMFEAADGKARGVNARTLATLLAPPKGPRGLVLQAAGSGSQPALTAAAAQVAQGGCPWVVVLPALEASLTRAALGALLGALIHGHSAERALAATRAELASRHAPTDGLLVCGSQAGQPLPSQQLATGPAKAAAADASPAQTVPAPGPEGPPATPDPLAAALKQKRSAGAFDVFLCHNSADKPAVRRLGLELKARGLLPWLDEWEFPPGRPWQPHLESVLKNIHSAAVCFGGSGIGPWQEEELYGFLREFKRRGCPVIPVLLPDAPLRPELPLFLQAMTWVDFRVSDPDPMARLIWGITGQHPEA